MFKLPKGRSYLKSAGYHAAHIIDAKNGDTDWESWSRDEIRRRTLVNIYPCNMVLVAKIDWRIWGGKTDVLEWARYRYQERYRSLMTSFLTDVGAMDTSIKSPTDIHYQYPKDSQQKPKHRGRLPQGSESKETDPLKVFGGGKTLVLKRPLIRKDLVDSGTALDISTAETRYLVPHDRLLDWVNCNTNALQTQNWKKNGRYGWPRPSRDMVTFLKRYEVNF